MAETNNAGEKKKFISYVPANTNMKEFTIRALLIGLVMCVVLGAANAYLGLKAGMTIAATYPAAVIGMALLKIMRGSILEENFARTVGSIGESVAAGAIFTIPAFVILHIWNFTSESMLTEYCTAAALMVLGGILGIMFVTILRRVMVEDETLPFPESVAAAEIHKAGQRGAEAAIQLFKAMAVGAFVKLMDGLGIFHSSNDFPVMVGRIKESFVKLGLKPDSEKILGGGITTISAPAATPAYIGVGYIIGPELGALNFAGGVLAWGLFVPLLVFFLGPQLIDKYMAASGGDTIAAWGALTGHLYRYIVRPIAVGGMLVGACYTLWKMRKNLILGIKRGIADVRKSAAAKSATERTQKDLPFTSVLLGITVVFALMIGLYFYFTNMILGAVLAAVVMLVAGFFFAAVSGNLVGMIGSSNNPISGLTLATTVVAALTMVIIGVKGLQGVAAVPRCCSSCLRFFRSCWRDAPGPKSWIYPRRHSVKNADRGYYRRHSGRSRYVFPALCSAQFRSCQPSCNRRIWRAEATRSAGRFDGGAFSRNRRRRNGMASRHRRHCAGNLADYD